MQRQRAQALLSRYEFVNRNHTPTSAHPNAGGPGFPHVALDTSLPAVVISDLDGTAATMGARSPYEHGLYHLDTPNEAVRLILHSVTHPVVYVSGRKEGARAETEAWLDKHGFPKGSLFLRGDHDNRKDDVVKYEILRDTIAKSYNPVLVLDDRNQVVAMWREQGIPTFQVAPGDFSTATSVEEFLNNNHTPTSAHPNAVARYVPDHNASLVGEWERPPYDNPADPHGFGAPNIIYHQRHEVLVRDALHSWTGDPVDMSIHMTDERRGAPKSGSGSGKIMRAQAGALLWELEHNSKPIPRLYRGADNPPQNYESWSEKRSVANRFAKTGQVYVLPKGTTVGLRIADYLADDPMGEKEWIVHQTPVVTAAAIFEEFDNHNHTPTSAHPNPVGMGGGAKTKPKFLSDEESAKQQHSKLVALEEAVKANKAEHEANIMAQVKHEHAAMKRIYDEADAIEAEKLAARKVTGREPVLQEFEFSHAMSPQRIKSYGAARGGEEIRNSPAHNKVVEDFLAQPFGAPMKGAATANAIKELDAAIKMSKPGGFVPKIHPEPKISPEAWAKMEEAKANDPKAVEPDRLTGLFGVQYHPKTIGEALIARRLVEMQSTGVRIAPLNVGHLSPAEVGALPKGVTNTEGRVLGMKGVTTEEFRQAMLNPDNPNATQADRIIARMHPDLTVPEIVANLRRNGLGDYVPNATDELVSSVQKSWQGSATNNSASLALMSRVASTHLGIEVTPAQIAESANRDKAPGEVVSIFSQVEPKTVRDANSELATRGPIYDALAYGIHAASVKRMEDMGYHPDDTIRLYRGMTLSTDTSPVAKAINDHNRVEIPGQPIRLQSDFHPMLVAITQNPLSSWTTDLDTARRDFGNYVFRYDFKVKDVFATAALGFGSLGEYELVPYGGGTINAWGAYSNYKPGTVQQPGKPEEAFSVLRTLEFLNHNHTPTSAHPNPVGVGAPSKFKIEPMKMSDVEKEAWKSIAQAEDAVITGKKIAPHEPGSTIEWSPLRSRVGVEEQAEVTKSLGAAKGGEAIRQSPEHLAAVEKFLAQKPGKAWIPSDQPDGMPIMMNEAHIWAQDSGLEFSTYGEMLVAARLAQIFNGAAYQAPLQSGPLHGVALDKYLAEFPITTGHTHTRLEEYKLQDLITDNHNMNSPNKPTVKEAISRMKADPVFREYIPNPIDELVSAAQSNWARSVTNSTPSLALMSTVAKMRGHEFVRTGNAGDPDWEPVVPKSMGSFITYGTEQEIVKELDRGAPYEALAYGIHAASEQHLASLGFHPDDILHLYRGVRDHSDVHMGQGVEFNATIDSNPISSWSANKIESRAFGNRIMSHDVKVKDVFATSATGFGSLGEEEVVPFGGRIKVNQILLAPSQKASDFEFAVVRPLEFITTDAGYSNAHKHINAVLGKASAHKCTKCGKRASHWSYDHKDPKEGTGTDHGAKRPYSDDPKHYKAFCISCHKTADLAHIAGSAEEFVNHNHTPTSAHPNAVGTSVGELRRGAERADSERNDFDTFLFDDHGNTTPGEESRLLGVVGPQQGLVGRLRTDNIVKYDSSGRAKLLTIAEAKRLYGATREAVRETMFGRTGVRIKGTTLNESLAIAQAVDEFTKAFPGALDGHQLKLIRTTNGMEIGEATTSSVEPRAIFGEREALLPIVTRIGRGSRSPNDPASPLDGNMPASFAFKDNDGVMTKVEQRRYIYGTTVHELSHVRDHLAGSVTDPLNGVHLYPNRPSSYARLAGQQQNWVEVRAEQFAQMWLFKSPKGGETPAGGAADKRFGGFTSSAAVAVHTIRDNFTAKSAVIRYAAVEPGEFAALEFDNHNHTPTSAHPNAVAAVPVGGPAVVGEFLNQHRDDVVHEEGQNDYISKSSPVFRQRLGQRRHAFEGGDNGFDPARHEAIELIKNWTGGENNISVMRSHPENWAKGVEFLKGAAVVTPVTIRRAIDFPHEHEIRVGDRIPNRMVASFTSADTEPHGYNTRIVIKAGDAHAVPISWLSNTPKEREWLVMSDFEVVSVVAGPSRPVVITVKEVPQ